MDTIKSNDNQRCSICGKAGPEKACSRCVTKYGNRFDLMTADGRYKARIAEQGTSDERWQREQQAKEVKWAKLREQREPLVAELTGKLASAQAALREGRFMDVAEALKGVGRLASKIARIA